MNTFRHARHQTLIRSLLHTLAVMATLFGAGWSRVNAAEWDASVEAVLAQAGTNRAELARAIEEVPPAERGGMLFLITNMPAVDVQSLKADFLLENVSMAYKVAKQAPWMKGVPEEIFLNEVLPYASLNEPRDNWRQRLYDICWPLVKDCKTAAEAGKVINQELFRITKVVYSTKRRATDQGPLETMESGMATCTGLSILLVDGCRAAGVPARIAGTPLWINKTGNHTWAEIWDGDWHFTGAAEQSPEGLDRGWFTGNAAQAIKDHRLHAIYATSFKRTGLSFPLEWAPSIDYVNAINITDRYTARTKPKEAQGQQLMVDVRDRPMGDRVAAQVMVKDIGDPDVHFSGTSKGETADMNDYLTFALPQRRTYLIEVELAGSRVQQYYTTGTNKQDRLAMFLTGIPPLEVRVPAACAPPAADRPLAETDAASLRQACDGFFRASASEQATWRFADELEALLMDNEPGVRAIVWEAYRNSPVHSELKRDFEAHQVRFEEHLSPYTVKTVGTRPANGWALFIAMHGGGGAPQELNDSQWRRMQEYYRDHPEAGGYIYVALRAPNNTWNGFYTGYVYPLIQNLLRQFLFFGDIDPNKKFIMGYSHGGYGAFAIGPKMPDYFAAIHSSAAAPADGADPITLRNTVFTCMLGTKDTMYGRYDLVRNFQEQIKKLRGERTDIYPVSVQLIADHPHSGLPDRDKIADMYPTVRNPVPRELSWRLTDAVIRDFFWLHVPAPSAGQEIFARIEDNVVVVTASTNMTSGSVLVDGRLIDVAKPVTVEFNGARFTPRLQPNLSTLCRTMQRRGDPGLAFTAEIEFPLTQGEAP